jgi:hypothetical protein
MSEKEKSDDVLDRQIKGSRILAVPGTDQRQVENRLVARNVLDTELGRYSDPQPVYGLNDETRDRLVAHARQDAAHALSNTITLMNDVQVLLKETRKTNRTLFLVFIGLAATIWLLVRKEF